MDGTSIETSVNGIAVFEQVDNGTHQYQAISDEHYKTVTGTVSVVGDTQVTVKMVNVAGKNVEGYGETHYEEVHN